MSSGIRTGTGGGLAPTRATGHHEATVSWYFERYVDQDHHLLVYASTRPLTTLAVVVALYPLPRHRLVLTDDIEGRGIQRALSHPWLLRWSPFHAATAVLRVPHNPADYSVGASKQTLRRMVQAARKKGVNWTQVHDHAERVRLLSLANDWERRHPLPRYREGKPHNDDLLDYRLWLAAYAPDGRPLLLCVTPVAGEWALLRYFRTLGVGSEESDSRYLMTQVLVETLSAHGVRFLAEASSPVGLPNGLRHYQRMLGFRIARVRP